MINEYPSPEEEKYSNERDITTIQTNKPVPEIYKECTGKYCSWFVEYAYSKCSGYVKLYIPFRVCSSECGRYFFLFSSELCSIFIFSFERLH